MANPVLSQRLLFNFCTRTSLVRSANSNVGVGSREFGVSSASQKKSPVRLFSSTATPNPNPKPASPSGGLVKTKEAAKRDATIAKFRKREEEERKYGATLPQTVILVGAGTVVAVLVAGAWMWYSGIFNRRSRRDSTLVTLLILPFFDVRNQEGEKGKIVTEDHQCNNVCAGCEKPIAGAVVAAGGSLWHPQHLVCHQCKTSLQVNLRSFMSFFFASFSFPS